MDVEFLKNTELIIPNRPHTLFFYIRSKENIKKIILKINDILFANGEYRYTFSLVEMVFNLRKDNTKGYIKLFIDTNSIGYIIDYRVPGNLKLFKEIESHF